MNEYNSYDNHEYRGISSGVSFERLCLVYRIHPDTAFFGLGKLFISPVCNIFFISTLPQAKYLLHFLRISFSVYKVGSQARLSIDVGIEARLLNPHVLQTIIYSPKIQPQNIFQKYSSPLPCRSNGGRLTLSYTEHCVACPSTAGSVTLSENEDF